MATGMEMMLKSFGFDPEKMRQDIARYAQIIVEMDRRQARLECLVENLITANNRMYHQLETLNTQLSGEPPNERPQDDTGARVAG